MRFRARYLSGADKAVNALLLTLSGPDYTFPPDYACHWQSLLQDLISCGYSHRTGFLRILAIAVLATGIATSPSLADSTRVVFVTHGQSTDPYWAIIKNGMNDAATKLGVTVEYHAPANFSTTEMRQMIEDAAASRPDGLVISMPDEKALSPAVKAATAAGMSRHHHRFRWAYPCQESRRPVLHGTGGIRRRYRSRPPCPRT